MNSSEINESTSTDEPEKVNFGDALLRARESKGYSITEVSKATLLSEAIIDAIEQSDMKRLPPPTFVQGYIRTYARYMDLPEEAIVDGFNRAVPYKRESQLHPRSTLPAQATMGSPWIRSISIVLVLLVLFALIYGVYGYYSRTAKTISLEKMNAVALKAPEQKMGDGQQNFAVAGKDQQSADTAVENDRGSTQPENGPATSADNAENTTVAVPSENEMPGTAAKAAPETTAATGASASAADAGTDVLDLKASDDSWVEITDADGKHLYHDLMRKNQSLRLQGKAPFNVFLGNAPAVDIRVNDAKVEMEGHIRSNNVARFTVTTSESGVVLH
jgi:cytoskeleton protein RodZ